MTNAKTTKRALLTSIMSLLLCFSMLLGTTYAWFTDSVSSANNIITAGNLDIELYYQNDEVTDWTKVDENTNIFKTGTLWEPGHTEVVKLKIANEGSLALKYILGLNVASEVGSVNVDGEEFNLSEFIMYGTTTEAITDRNKALDSVAATATKLNVENDTNKGTLNAGTSTELSIVVYMPTTVGNKANFAKGEVIPTINFGIDLFATQHTYESDSFDDHYDAGAPYELPAGVGVEDFGTNVAYINGAFYPTVKAALEGLHAEAEASSQSLSAGTKTNALYLKPFTDLGTMTHGHVCSSLTVYGNGSYFSSGEGDFEVDTYKFCHNGAKTCAGLTDDLTLTIYNVGGVAVWGQRTTEHTININLYNCEDVNRVYISTADDSAAMESVTNVTIDNCTYDGTNGYYNTAVYTNNPGTLNISNTTIKAYAIGINQNNKSKGTQNINLTNCTFIDCATSSIAAAAGATAYAAPVRVVATREATAVSNLTMVGCKFEYAKQNYNYYSVDGDILITDKREGKPNNGKVNVVVDGQKIDYFVSTKAEFTEAVAVENAVVFCNLLKSNYGYFFFSSSGKDPYKHGLPNIAKGVTVIGDTKLPYNGAPAMFGIKAPVNNKLNDVTFRNINFNGSNVQYGFDNYLYGNVVYENCIINASSDRAIHWADGDGTATYKNCEIQGRVAISSTVSAVNFIGCKFTNSSQTANHNLYTNATYTDCTFDLKDGTVTKAAIYADGSKVVMNNCTNVNGNLSDLCNASNGGSFTIDGAPLVKGTDALKEALASGATEVVVGAGEYTFPTSSLKEGTTLICEGTVFTGNSKLNINGATVVGATFSNPTGSAADQTINGTFKNCTFTGSNGLRYCYAGETVVFENCVFDGAVYGAHFDGGANEVLFKNCTFSGFNAFAGGVTKLTLDGCTFKSNGRSGYNGANLWGSTDLINCTFIFDGSAGTEWIHARGTEKTYNITNCVVTDGVNVSDLQTVFSDNGTNNTVTFN